METNDEDIYKNVLWANLFPSIFFEKINICNQSYVNKKFLDNLIFLGYSNDYEKILNILFTEEEIHIIKKYWKDNKINYPYKIYLFRHHIPNYKKVNNIIKYTKIIYGIFDYNDCFKLSSILEESIDNELSKKIIANTSRNLIEYPWINKYHTKMVNYYTELLSKNHNNIKIKKYISFKEKFLKFFDKI